MGFSADTLRDRVAIVTGASQGIGCAIAVEMAAVGAQVIVCSRRLPALEATAQAVRERGGRALAMACDVGSAEQVDALIDRAHAEFGRLDILVNNAAYRSRGPFETLPRAEWDTMLRSNLTGVFLCCQAAARLMIPRRSGVIINIGSVAGRNGSRGMVAYAATKAAVTALTQSLGAEWAKYGIRVNAIAPGAIGTESAMAIWKTPEMISRVAREVPLGRLGRPEEIAAAAVFIASDAASFMTGETIYIGGGPQTGGREDRDAAPERATP